MYNHIDRLEMCPCPVYSPAYQQPVVISYSPVSRYPSVTTCASCRFEVTTDVTYETGAFTWAVCGSSLFCG